MTSDVKTVDEYLASIDPKWKKMIENLREVILENLPQGFEETITYGMIGYVVPHSIYPPGYHARPGEPLPFINLAAQKNNISLYHMGMYGNQELGDWFTRRYREKVGRKPDMGKSCIRFRKDEDIPYDLLEELFGKITAADYIKMYEKSINNRG